MTLYSFTYVVDDLFELILSTISASFVALEGFHFRWLKKNVIDIENAASITLV